MHYVFTYNGSTHRETEHNIRSGRNSNKHIMSGYTPDNYKTFEQITK